MKSFRFALLICLAMSGVRQTAHAEAPEDLPGAPIFAAHCSGCHLGQVPKAPSKVFLQMMPADSIISALTTGIMQGQGTGLTADQKQEVAEYLSGEAAPDTAAAPSLPQCRAAKALRASIAVEGLRSWGFDQRNSRMIPAAVSKLDAADIPRLRLKWALDFHGAIRARSQPTFAYGMLFVGSQNGTVYALDPTTGCVHWTFRASAEVRTPVVVASDDGGPVPPRRTAFFGDILGHIYAIDAVSGALKWKRRLDDHPSATITGAPLYHASRLYVPVSSLEESAVGPTYACCTFRGSLVSLDAETGATIWKSYTINSQAIPTGGSASGLSTLGPSGAAIWNAPTLDVSRGLLYVGTSNNYSAPATAMSDSVVAFDITNGAVRWHRQFFAGDAWNDACVTSIAGCPDDPGPDFDIGAGTLLLKKPGGGDLVLVATKEGTVFAVDADKHDVVWQSKLGRGSIQGGIQFAMAADSQRLYVPISDVDNAHSGAPKNVPARPGLYALNPTNGKLLWAATSENLCSGREFCDPGILAAITVIRGTVFAGHMDGRLRAYDSKNGKVLWSYDTLPEITTVTGSRAHGGTIGGGGPVVYRGMVYVNSGYGLYDHLPGNLLLAFSVDGR